VTDFEIPATGSAEVHVLHEGYVGKASRDLLRGVAAVIIPGHGAPFRPGAGVTFE
jgi:hypothetical protein